MTCRDVEDIMNRVPGTPARVPEAIQHLIKCQGCRTLMSVLHKGGKTWALRESQLKQIEARILEDLKPVRPLAPSRFFLFACAAILLCILAIGVTRLGMNGWGALGIGQRIRVFSTLAGGAILLTVSMVGQMVPGSKYALAPAVLPIAILATLIIVLAATFHARDEHAFVPNGLACMRNGITYSISAAFLFWLVVRRGAILYPKLIGAAAGGLAGLIGLSVLEITCSNLNIFHLLVWHWGLVLISSAAGTLLGAAVESIQRRRGQNAS